ncbi:hypothetical protein LCGC14_2889110 [marine sediment metagenome]|uniref:Uncharacterized protein n=1 Tax=marine sediment metagenome TaxID=412755 RepID=A0A0F8XXV0_9ZZZZ
MYWQREYLREGVGMTLNETYRLELPDHGFLGSLLLRLSGGQASGYGQGEADWRIIDRIPKIEVIGNGSTIIKSVTGYIAQALASWDQGIIPPGVWKNYATNTQWEYILINFGRKLYDRDYGLDLSRFDDIELRIQNDAGAAQFGDLAVAVVGFWKRDDPAGGFNGYMRSEDWRTWTVVRDETQYLTLPTDNMIRRVILQAIPPVDSDFVEKTGMNNLMDDIKLALESGQKLVYQGGVDDLMRENYLHYGNEFIVAATPYMLADDGIDLSLGYVIGGAWGAGSQDGAVAGTNATFETGRTSFTQKPETYEADSPANIMVKGMAPFLTAIFPFDWEADPATWLDPNRSKSVTMDVHSRDHADVVGGVNKVSLDRLVNA